VQQVVGAVAISFSANERGRHDKKNFAFTMVQKSVWIAFFRKIYTQKNAQHNSTVATTCSCNMRVNPLACSVDVHMIAVNSVALQIFIPYFFIHIYLLHVINMSLSNFIEIIVLVVLKIVKILWHWGLHKKLQILFFLEWCFFGVILMQFMFIVVISQSIC